MMQNAELGNVESISTASLKLERSRAMAKWNVEDNGTQYEIEYKRSLGGGKIIVNGSVQKVKSQNAFLNLVDFPIRLTNKAVNVVVIGNKADLVPWMAYIWVPISLTCLWLKFPAGVGLL